MTSDLEVRKVTKLEGQDNTVTIKNALSADTNKTVKSNVYSLSSHFKNAERNQ